MIPSFTADGLLPPFLGSSPAVIGSRAPFRTSVFHVIDRFATSPERVGILSGLLDYRETLHGLGIVDGFQWLDGSFVESIETIEGRPPGDIDIVTFYRHPAVAAADADWIAFQVQHGATFDALFGPALPKQTYKCDAYPVELDVPPETLVFATHYWFGLFSHRRRTFEWKGLLEVPMFDPAADGAARQLLATRGGP
jgi:hypothetical protein